MTTREIFYSTVLLALSAFAALCFTVGMCGCGGRRDQHVLVVVGSSGRLSSVESLRLVVETSTSERSLPLDVPIAGGAADIPPERTFSLDVPRPGRLRVIVEALREGIAVASGVGEGEAEVRVELPGEASTFDLTASSDLSTADLRVPPLPPDLNNTVKDLVVVVVDQVDQGRANLDLADLVVPDLARPDIATAQDLVTPAPLPDLSSPPPDLHGCLSSLAHVGAGDFTITFGLANDALGQPATLLAQRAACDNSKPYWYVGIKPDGGVYALTGGPTGYAGVNSSTAFNGKLRRVRVLRRGGSLALAVDGNTEASMPSTTSLDALAPLEIGKSDACGTTVVAGVSITDVCLSIP